MRIKFKNGSVIESAKVLQPDEGKALADYARKNYLGMRGSPYAFLNVLQMRVTDLKTGESLLVDDSEIEDIEMVEKNSKKLTAKQREDAEVKELITNKKNAYHRMANIVMIRDVDEGDWVEFSMKGGEKQKGKLVDLNLTDETVTLRSEQEEFVIPFEEIQDARLIQAAKDKPAFPRKHFYQGPSL